MPENFIQNTGKKIGSGLVFGKFMPLHKGHLHLLNFARESCHRLTILVCSLKSEPIPGDIRYHWVKTMFPDANVVNHYDEIPQDPSEHPDFWNIWRESIKRHCPGEEFDALFGSEDYGWKMATAMGIQYVPVDRLRDLVPTSGTALRQNPLANWDYLPHVVKPYFLKKVAIVGPESTGKSTLTKKLAAHFNTAHVDEYARRLLDEYVANRQYQPGEVRFEDIATIARGQIVTETARARYANKILFCDTDLITTKFWSNYYFKQCPKWVEEEGNSRRYDLHILLEPTVPWVEDAQRPMPDLKERQEFARWFEMELIKQKRPFIKISQEDWEERLQAAVVACEKLMN